jgi:hypothetical protein
LRLRRDGITHCYSKSPSRIDDQMNGGGRNVCHPWVDLLAVFGILHFSLAWYSSICARRVWKGRGSMLNGRDGDRKGWREMRQDARKRIEAASRRCDDDDANLPSQVVGRAT